MDWEACLENHQRPINEQLIRVSRHLMRHIVDAETAVDDIAKTYLEDGEHLISNLVQKNREQFAHAHNSIQTKKQNMRTEFEQLAKEMADEKGLRRQQKIEQIRKEFEKHPDNPFNQATAGKFDLSKDEMKQMRDANKTATENRLAG